MARNGPSPSPASANVSSQGANKLEKNTCLMIFSDFLFFERVKKFPVRGPKIGSARKVQPPFFRGGPERVNPTMTTSTVTARKKGDPEHYVEGKTIQQIIIKH